jgi:hypothetical protein
LSLIAINDLRVLQKYLKTKDLKEKIEKAGKNN